MSLKSKEWKPVRGTWIAPNQVLPGVWQCKEGGHAVRGRATDPRTGKQRDIWKVLPNSNKNDAYTWLQTELARIRAGDVAPEASRTRFSSYAVSLLKQKIAPPRSATSSPVPSPVTPPKRCSGVTLP